MNRFSRAWRVLTTNHPAANIPVSIATDTVLNEVQKANAAITTLTQMFQAYAATEQADITATKNAVASLSDAVASLQKSVDLDATGVVADMVEITSDLADLKTAVANIPGANTVDALAAMDKKLDQIISDVEVTGPTSLTKKIWKQK